VVVTWIPRRPGRRLDPAAAQRTTRASARAGCTGIGRLAAIDSAAPPVGPGAPRRS